MKKLLFFSTLLVIFPWTNLIAQDLDKILNNLTNDKTPNYALGTFKGTTIINGQSVEVPGESDLNFVISHRFGAVNQGIYGFFGLDQGTTRLGFEYGFKNIASVSVGRNNIDKIYDGGLKIRVLRQQTGLRTIPISISVYSSVFINSLKWQVTDRNNLFSSRFSYTNQILIARKFNKNLSLQLSPSWVHINLVPLPEDQNNIFSVGLAGRYKLTRKISLNGEYFYLLPGTAADKNTNSLSCGFDFETGGHVFQIHVTNSQPMFARGFIAQTQGNWKDGNIYIGFNIYRIFSLKRKV